MRTLKCIAASLALLSPLCSLAQEESKLSLAPAGRILVDGALYASPQKELFPDGMAIPEARLGARMSYGKWSSYLDVAFAYSKIGLRNMYIQYNFNPENWLRFGNFIHQFGLQTTTSASLKCTYEMPMVSAIFSPGILLGAMYTHQDRNFFGAASFHVESSALSTAMNYPLYNKQGYGLLTRLVWHKAEEGKAILHAGVSGGFATPQRHLVDNNDVHDAFTFSAYYPTKVAQTEAIGTTVTESKNLFKFSPELLLAYGKIALESQYFYQRINRRHDLPGFNSYGAYATLRGIIVGDSYQYAYSTADLARPKAGSLECVIDYNYTNISDNKAGIYGGRANNFNVTFNYYINPYITARLNYTYTHTWDRAGADPTSLNGFQARLMVLF